MENVLGKIAEQIPLAVLLAVFAWLFVRMMLNFIRDANEAHREQINLITKQYLDALSKCEENMSQQGEAIKNLYRAVDALSNELQKTQPRKRGFGQ